MQQLLWFRDDFAASSSRSRLLLTRAGLFERCFLLLWSTAPALVGCGVGVLGAGRLHGGGTVPADPDLVSEDAWFGMLGCPYPHEQVRPSLAKLGLLGSEYLASADAASLFLSSRLPWSLSLEMCTRFSAMVFAKLNATLVNAVCYFAPIFIS